MASPKKAHSTSDATDVILTDSSDTPASTTNTCSPAHSSTPKSTHDPQWPCSKCGKKFIYSKDKNRHQVRCNARHPRTVTTRNDQQERDSETNAILIKDAFEKRLMVFFIENFHHAEEIDSFFTLAFDTIIKLIRRYLLMWGSVMINFSLDTCYNIPQKDEDPVERSFKTTSNPIFHETDIEDVIHDGIMKIEREMQEYEGKGSGFSLFAIEGILLNISKYNPLRAGCYLPLPKWVQMTRSVDHSLHDKSSQDCFRLAILAGDNKKQYNFHRVTFPTPLKDIGYFERDNPRVAINIFSLNEEEEQGTIFPLRTSQVNDPAEHFDLLLLSNDSGTNHFVRIFDFEKLVRSQLTKRTHAIAVCRRCFSHFDDRGEYTREERLTRHQEHGCMETPAIAEVPKEGQNVLSFTNHKNKIRLPFVIYADVESLLIPISTCSPSGSFIKKYQEHKMMAYSIFVKCDVETIGCRTPI